MRGSPRNSASILALFSLLVTVEARAADRAWSVAGSPVAVAAAAGRVYVADFDHDRIEVFTRDGASIAAWGGSGSEPGQFHGPAGIACDGGSILVTDLYNHRVQRFGPDGTFLASWAVGASPLGIAVDRGGRIYVTDLDAGRVSVWSRDGAAIAAWGTRGRGDGELDQPWGIAVDGQGEVLVADHGNDRIQRFSGNGDWLGAWGSDATEFAGPMGIAVDRDGSVLVSDLAGAPLQRFARNGERMVMSGAVDAGREVAAAGLGLDAGGDVLLADAMGRQVVRVAGAGMASVAPAPTAFAMLPIAQPLGHGPITLEFAVPGPGTIGASFYSLDGRRVHTVADASCDAGAYRITWDAVADDGHHAPTGIYFVRAHFRDGVSQISRSGRVVVLR